MERIHIEFRPEEGALLRILGLVERRGFRVLAIAMETRPDGARASATLDIAPRDAGRQVDMLLLQLHRLFDVVATRRVAARIASAA